MEGRRVWKKVAIEPLSSKKKKQEPKKQKPSEEEEEEDKEEEDNRRGFSLRLVLQQSDGFPGKSDETS